MSISLIAMSLIIFYVRSIYQIYVLSKKNRIAKATIYSFVTCNLCNFKEIEESLENRSG